MKRIKTFLLLAAFASLCLHSQTVDSIRVEQAGDFIKVYYRLPGSVQEQSFRVSIMASINGGLKSELRSISGDVGENIVGGKQDYWIIWDVLKDVEELNSVEFFIRAELTRDISEPVREPGLKADNIWNRRIFTIMPVISIPGPRIGIMAGVNGSVGGLASFAVGEVASPTELPMIVGGEEYHRGDGIQMSINLTKRIVSYQAFQLHLAAGFSVAAMDYSVTDYNAMTQHFDTVMTRGFSAGLLFGAARLTGSLFFMKYDPGSVEKSNENYFLITPMNLFTAGIGIRF